MQLNRRMFLASSLAALGVSPLAFGGTPVLSTHPLAPLNPHFEGKAKRVILFFLTGGASHVDSFDPKPKLREDHGKPFGPTSLLGSPWESRPRGKCGTTVSDLFPTIAENCMDDICVIRSMHGDHNCHYQATLGMHTGSVTFPRPSIGSWVSYGLGTYNANLPSYVVIAQTLPYAGALVYDANFLPAYHQGVRLVPGSEPIPNLLPAERDRPAQDLELSLLDQLNARHARQRQSDNNLRARILSFKTAFGLQTQAPEVFDLATESDSVLKLYGIDRSDNRSFGWQCLMARRLAERGVRFIELIDIGASKNWDAHGDIKTHEPLARRIDRPIAALLQDLKQHGMLDDTLVVFSTEFGRSPFAENGAPQGRTHHNRAFSCWLAGGGVKGGTTYGASDEYGSSIVDKPVHTHDFHATILHLMGMDHTRLTYRHSGRDFRLTDVAGDVVKCVLA